MPGGEKNGLNIQVRVRLAFLVVCAAFVVISATLWYLQVVRGAHYRERSENNRLRAVFVPPPRGVVLDRNGEVLVKNRPAFNVELVLEDCPDPPGVAARVAELVGEDVEVLKARLKAQGARRRYEPKILLKDVDRDRIARVMAHRYELPGVVVNVTPTRDYPHGEVAAHVLGYIREISQQQLESERYRSYRRGDIIGQFGIESTLEPTLQGKRGVEFVVVNAFGSRIGGSSFEPASPGHAVRLTLDLPAQRAADAAMKGKSGAVVALRANTGEVLALTSNPAFDPNIFTSEIDPSEWRDLTTGRARRMTNRVVQGTYAPGSVFKMVVAAAALAEGVIDPRERIFCPGYLNFGGRPFKCHKHSGHGAVDLYDSLVQSCDVYYYTVGQRLGVDRIHDYSIRFGLGRPTGLELISEARGIIPSTEWKRTYFKDPANKKWFPGETLSVAIGQGAVTTTPLQLAQSMAALVNGGFLVTPSLVLPGSGSKEGEPRRIDVDPKILKTVADALVGVVADPRGTGHRARLSKELNISVGGKTGTAQVVSLEKSHGHSHLKDNAWFVGFAPAEAPEIVVAAIVENGGHGGAAAAPVVRAVMEGFFGRGKPLSSDGEPPQSVEDEANAD
ncbi:MAG: hypothetical protein RL417_1091 [Pseudomonadota bacterium]|jgi:penicillin-binding protein 2